MDGVKVRNIFTNCLVIFGVACAILVFLDATYWQVGMSPLYSTPGTLSFPGNIGVSLVYLFSFPGFIFFGLSRMALPTDIPVTAAHVIEYTALFLGQIIFYYLVGLLFGSLIKSALTKK
ncbi:MAG: hypothetical protein GY750_03565 [Lentisphaerae bacterium]|nr:hypothetical protein [Lentisphaerota bacterium]MCP4100496.1 hypothetical protein [Lentisphaerota bacterium]